MKVQTKIAATVAATFNAVLFLSTAHAQSDATTMQNRIGNIINNQGIVTQGQAGNNTVVQAPAPTFRTVQNEMVTPNNDGTYNHAWIIEIVAPSYPAANLVGYAKGATAREFEIAPVDGRAHMFSSGIKDGILYVRHDNPFGQYRVIVKTTDSVTPVGVTLKLNEQ